MDHPAFDIEGAAGLDRAAQNITLVELTAHVMFRPVGRGFSDDPLIQAARGGIDAVVAGASVDEAEGLTLDFKEETGRRAKNGAYGPGRAENEDAAKALAEEACCLANSEGGVLVVGIANKGVGPDALVGAEMNEEWLRNRIWSLTDPSLAVEIQAVGVEGVRLLLILVQRSYRLHRSAKKYKHRIGTQCVEMSADDQRHAEDERFGYDWSDELSDATIADVSEGAVDRARGYLREAGESSRDALAERPTADLLRNLGVLDKDDRLTNGGRLLFVTSEHVLVDYKRRNAPGTSSTDRKEVAAPLLDAYATIKNRIDAVNDEHELQLPSGVRPRIRLIPDRAVREALVNALIHRDYRSADPVDIEFVGKQLVVSSPGGFPANITAANIISERSHPRNAALTAVFRSLRLAEREGIGVDRMYRDMVSAGHATPEFADTGGRVRCVLIGGEPSPTVVALMASLPAASQEDVDLALILHVLTERASVAPEDVAQTLQKLLPEAADALGRGEKAGLLVQTYRSTRARPRYRLADGPRDQLQDRLPYVTTSSDEAEEFVVRHLHTQEQVKPRDVADMLNVTEVQGSRILKDLRLAKVVQFGSENERGRGVFHVRGPRFAEASERHGVSA